MSKNYLVALHVCICTIQGERVNYVCIHVCMCVLSILLLYNVGDRYMTASMHGLMHLPESVRNLWAHSCFGFEAANGEVLKWFHGSQSVEKQVNSELQGYTDPALSFEHPCVCSYFMCL